MESSVHTLCSMKLLGSLYEMDCSHRPSEFPVGQIPSPYSQAEDSKSVTSQTPQGQGSGLRAPQQLDFQFFHICFQKCLSVRAAGGGHLPTPPNWVLR